MSYITFSVSCNVFRVVGGGFELLCGPAFLVLSLCGDVILAPFLFLIIFSALLGHCSFLSYNNLVRLDLDAFPLLIFMSPGFCWTFCRRLFAPHELSLLLFACGVKNTAAWFLGFSALFPSPNCTLPFLPLASCRRSAELWLWGSVPEGRLCDQAQESGGPLCSRAAGLGEPRCSTPVFGLARSICRSAHWLLPVPADAVPCISSDLL